MIGQTISHYRIVERLGAGGMGVVYEAEDLNLGRRVALKFLPQDLAKNPHALERFKQEARAASSLNHPNICTIHEIGEAAGDYFIAMELLDGKSLDKYIAWSPIGQQEFLALAIQIADALDAAHTKGIIHRDIKPANIFVTAREQIKILDFGLAKLAAEGKLMAQDADATAKPTATLLTSPGTVVGTVAYMSPEQARGKELDARTDLFSFGAVLYQMATGRCAFDGETSAVIFEAILNREPVSPRQVNPELPLKVEEIIGTAMEKDRDLRYQSAAEIRAELKRLKRKTESGRSAPTTGSLVAASPALAVRSAEGVSGPNRWLLGISVACVIALAGMFTWVMRSRSPIRLSDLRQKQLTSNSVGNSVANGAISPDGKYLAYVDSLGMHVQLIANGDTQTVSTPESLDANAAWLIASWFPDSTSFLANATVPGGGTSIWIVSLFGRAPRKIRDDATAWSVSPDGSQIAFTAVPGLFGSREVWFMTKEGEQARKVFAVTEEGSGLARVAWSPDGQRVGYLRSHQLTDRFEFSIETRDLNIKSTTVLLTSFLLHDFYWLPDGRIVYSLGEGKAAGSDDCNLWEVRVRANGTPVDPPRRLTNWAGFDVDHLSATSDGKRLVFQKWSKHFNVHTGELQDRNTKLTALRTLTLSEAANFPTAWTADSKAVIFHSDRNGHWGIYKQTLNQDSAEALVSVSDTLVVGRTSPDGKWILYFTIPTENLNSPDSGGGTSLRLMRIPVAGGPAELVLTARLYGTAWCARSPSTLCAFAERTADRKELVFTAFDPIRGKGRELAKFATDPSADYGNWSPSPDGTRLGIIKTGGNHIYVLPLDRAQVRDITVEGWNGLNSFDWSVDSKGFFTSNTTGLGSTLLFVDLNGKAHSLWQQKSAPFTWGVPSPDGRHLAVLGLDVSSNIWMIENF
jgi:eukaryotic-like serine/threonine-protein kinase